jgi:glycosyltransferase involved in cell wall biosynthesis
VTETDRQARRVLICYWGSGGAGVRFSYRVACEVAASVGAENVDMSLNAANAWLDRCKAEFGNVSAVSGPVGRASVLSSFRHLPNILSLFRAQIRQRRPDLVILTMNFAQAVPLAYLLRWYRIPFAYVSHDAWPHPGDYWPLMQRLTQRILLSRAARIVSLSGFVGQQLLEMLPSSRLNTLKIIPLVNHIRPRVDAVTKGADETLKFLFLGRLIEYKGLLLLAAALSLLEDRDDWTLTIAGNGPMRDRVRSVFSQNPKVDMSRLNWLLESDVDELLATHDVLVCPYIEASQSGVIAEAQSFGVPTIVTPVGGLREQIGSGSAGWSADAVTPDAFARSMRHVLTHRDDVSAKAVAALAMALPVAGKTAWGEVVRSISPR